MDFLDRFLPPSLLQNPRTRRRGRLIVGTCAALFVVLGIGLVIRLAIRPLRPSALALAIISLAALIVLPWLLRRTGSLVLTGWLTTCIFSVLIVVEMIWAGGPDAPVAILVPLIPLLATHLVGPQTGRWTAGLLLLVIVVWTGLRVAGYELPTRDLTQGEDTMAHGLMVCLSIVLMTLLAAGYELQRKILEIELRQTDALYRRLFDQSKDMVALAKPSGRLLDVNQAGVELYGYRSRDAFLSTDVRELYANPKEREELLRRLERDGFVRNFETLQRRADGEVRVVQGTTTAVRDEKGRISHFLAIMRDVTEERNAAAERERMVRELERKNRDLESFTYAVSHDLKSPLFTIRGFLELLAGDARSGDISAVLDDIDHMLGTTEKMQALVDGLLQLAQVGATQDSLAPQSLAEICHEVMELLQGRLHQNGVQVKIQPDLPSVYGDRVLLSRLMQNLMDNAAKFLAGHEDPVIEIGRRLDGDKVVFFVRDNGPGIKEADKEKIFGLFSKLDREGVGTGVGLAIVKKVIDLHGGELWVESDGPGQGATFCFTVPTSPS